MRRARGLPGRVLPRLVRSGLAGPKGANPGGPPGVWGGPPHPRGPPAPGGGEGGTPPPPPAPPPGMTPGPWGGYDPSKRSLLLQQEGAGYKWRGRVPMTRREDRKRAGQTHSLRSPKADMFTWEGGDGRLGCVEQKPPEVRSRGCLGVWSDGSDGVCVEISWFF